MRLFTLFSLIACAAASASNAAAAGAGHWSALRKPLANGTPAERGPPLVVAHGRGVGVCAANPGLSAPPPFRGLPAGPGLRIMGAQLAGGSALQRPQPGLRGGQ